MKLIYLLLSMSGYITYIRWLIMQENKVENLSSDILNHLYIPCFGFKRYVNMNNWYTNNSVAF